MYSKGSEERLINFITRSQSRRVISSSPQTAMSRSVDFLSRASTSSSNYPGPSTSTSKHATTLPLSSRILITDTLSCPSLFLLTQLIVRQLRKPSRVDIKGKGKASKVVLVGVREVESEYNNILKKQASHFLCLLTCVEG